MQSYRDATALLEGLNQREFSVVELTQHYLARIGRHNDALNALISIDEAGAIAAAKASDERRAGDAAGPLDGLPIVHKDLFCTAGTATTCASRMLANFVAPYDATVVQRLAAAGTITLGKANMDEFAMGSSNENSHFGAVANPHDTARVPGGSSGGSAAAVAADLTPWATGTDTGGSIRQPAAFCGVSGLKPTYGRVSRYGMIAFASSLDQGGPIARSVRDLALMLEFMAGFDAADSTSAQQPVPTTTELLAAARPLRVGVPQEYFEPESSAHDAIDAARSEFEALGCTFHDVSLPHTKAAIPVYYVLSGAEASTNLSRYDGVRFGYRSEAATDDLTELYEQSRSEGFGSEVKRRILTGTYALSVGYYDAYYLQAQKIRRLIQQDFLAAFEEVDVLLTPTTPDVAFAQASLVDDPVAMYQQDTFTTPASLAGLPALSIPVGERGGLPLGMQLIAPHFNEATLTQLGHAYQQQTDWHERHPEAFA